jgi:hypothetical protein
MEELKAKLRADFQRTRRLIETIKRFEVLSVAKQRKGKKKLRTLVKANEDILARNYVKELEGARRTR